MTKAELQAENDQLRADVERLAAPKLLNMNYEQGGGFEMTMETAQSVMLRLVQAAATILDDAENYAESVIQELRPAGAKPKYVITIQRHNGKTPHEKRQEAEAALAKATKERDKLQAFKDWMHQYLDGKGIPHHPPGPHGAEGCRIGDRMDYVFERFKETA